MTDPGDFNEQRRRIIRRISLLTWGLWSAAVLMAVSGGALLAWFLSTAGLPFLTTWLVASVLLLAIPAALYVLTNKRVD
ncbi:MAG TPA: hypothetical protein VMM83_05255 [Longimicrobiales bacterium]|nr:hypothetical protein [Longimicrobiales bacterium]